MNRVLDGLLFIVCIIVIFGYIHFNDLAHAAPIDLDVDFNAELNIQKQVDNGHQPWK